MSHSENFPVEVNEIGITESDRLIELNLQKFHVNNNCLCPGSNWDLSVQD